MNCLIEQEYLRVGAGDGDVTKKMPVRDTKTVDFEHAFDRLPEVACVVDSSNSLVYVNAAFTHVLGYSREEVVGQAFSGLVHPQDRERTREELLQCDVADGIAGFINRHRHQNGRYRFLEWSVGGDPDTGIRFCIARDVTEESQERHQFKQVTAAVNSGSIVMWTDKHGVITDVNERFCRISRYPRDELIGMTHRILNSDIHGERFFSRMWKKLSAGETCTGLLQNRRKSGEAYYVNCVITPIYDMDGKIRQYVAVGFDVTRQIEAQNAYRKSAQMLNDLCSVAKIGAWELDVSTGDLTWTDETFRIFELEKRDGQKPRLADGLDLYSDEAKPVIEHAVTRAIETGEAYSLELLAKTTRGREFWVSTNGQANIENGRIVSVHGTIQDIDDKKKAEQRYERERSMSIHNAKLASLGEMAAGVAHEINNPLAVVSGSAQLMEIFIDNPDKMRDRIADIQKSTHRITRIVDSLRKFSRSDTSQKRELHCLNQILRESLSLTAAKARRYRTEVKLSGSANVKLCCDEVEIEQVLVNLINNAIDACSGSECRWVELNTSTSDDVIELRVTDSGRGIHEPTSEKLFDPFFTTKRAGEGTGLGLSISRGIVEDHGGTIVVDRSSTQTCFLLRLPVAAEQAENPCDAKE